jgi:hypothetical protein
MPHRSTEAFDEEQEHVRLATAMMEAFRPIVVPADAVRRSDPDMEAALQVIRFYADERHYEPTVEYVVNDTNVYHEPVLGDRGQFARDFLQKRIDRK